MTRAPRPRPPSPTEPWDSPRGEAEPAGHRAAPPEARLPTRPAWVEIDLDRLRRNFELINQDKPGPLEVLSVVKDDGYGHGALPVARTALGCGARFLALSTVEEAMRLRDRGIGARLLLLGD